MPIRLSIGQTRPCAINNNLFVLEATLNDQSGITAILAVFIFSATLLVAALAIETGWVFYVKNEAQAAVDAAALSGLAGIPDYSNTGSYVKVGRLIEAFNGGSDPSKINSVAKQSPNIQLGNVEFIRYENGVVTLETDYRRVNGLRVTKTYTPPLLLGNIIRREGNQPITVQAVAALMGPQCSVPDLPFALIDCSSGQNQICMPAQCDISFTVALNDAGPGDTMAFFDLPNGNVNANTCAQMASGSLTADRICDSNLIELSNGAMASCLTHIKNECNRRGCSSTNPWKVTVPNVSCNDLAQGNSTHNVPIRGFSRIGITSVVSHGSTRRVTFVLLCNELTNEKPSARHPCGFYIPPVLVQ